MKQNNIHQAKSEAVDIDEGNPTKFSHTRQEKCKKTLKKANKTKKKKKSTNKQTSNNNLAFSARSRKKKKKSENNMKKTYRKIDREKQRVK